MMSTTEGGMRLVVLVYGLLIAQRILGAYVPMGWVHPQLMLPLCVYLGMTRFSVRSAVVVFGSGLLMDAIGGPILGPWAGASISAFFVAGMVSRRVVLPSAGLSGVVLFVGAFLSFCVFHAMHLADTSAMPPLRLIVEEAFMTALGGAIVVPAIRWWLEPRRGRRQGDARYSARQYA